jgi:hypothetical protein
MQWLDPCLVEGSSEGICIPDALRLQQSSPWHDDETGFSEYLMPVHWAIGMCTKLVHKAAVSTRATSKVLQPSTHDGASRGPSSPGPDPHSKSTFCLTHPAIVSSERLVASGVGREDEPPVEYVVRRGFTQFVTFQTHAFPQSFACLQGVWAMQSIVKLDAFYRFIVRCAQVSIRIGFKDVWPVWKRS